MTPRPADHLRQRLAAGIGLAELDELEPRLARLEEAVAENTRLAQPLARHVGRLEEALLPALENTLGAEQAHDDS